MVLKYQLYSVKEKYHWKCPLCFHKQRLTIGSILHGLELTLFDQVLQLWVDGSSYTMSARLSDGYEICKIHKVLRQSTASYFKLLKPYLIFNQCVAIDETQVGSK